MIVSNLHEELAGIVPVNAKNKDRAIENIRAIAEEIIWSEQNQGEFFNYVVDSNLLRLFWNILQDNKIKEVQIQIIQSATLLIHNLTSDRCKSNRNIEYLLKSLLYKDIVSFNFDFSDEEVVEIYMSMLKAFAVNLKADMFSEFLTNNDFALLTGTMMFMNYHESMIKTAARTVVLSIFTRKIDLVKPRNIKEYIVQSGFFNLFVSNMSDKLTQCDRYILSNSAAKLESSLSEILEDLYYIHDIFELQISEFSEILTNLMLKCLIYPIAIASLGAIHPLTYHISIPLAAVFLHQVLRIVKHASLVNALVMGLLIKMLPQELTDLLQDSPSPNLHPNQDFLYSTNRLLDHLEGFEYIENLKPNYIPEVLYSFLTSKDNNLVGVVLMLLNSVITSVSVNNNLLLASGLISYEKVRMKKLLNSILEEKDTKMNYNEQTVESLLNLLGYEQPLRVFHFKLACKVLISLAYRPEKQICLTGKHQRILNKAFCRSIDNLQTFLVDSLDYDVFFHVFYEEWKNINLCEVKLQVSVVLLLPYCDENANLPLELRDPNDEFEALHAEVQRFFHLWGVKLSLYRDKSIFPLSVYPIYYLADACCWEKDKSYEMDSMKCVKCSVKLLKNEEYMFYASDPDFFLLVQPMDNKENYIYVKVVESLLNVEVIQDRADPRRLVVMVNSDSFDLVFADPQRCYWTLKEIVNNKNGCKERYILLVSKLFAQLGGCN